MELLHTDGERAETNHFAADWQSLAVAELWVADVCAKFDIVGETLNALQVCFEELSTNIVRHGKRRQADQPFDSLGFQATIWRRGKQVKLIIADNARKFDLAAALARGSGSAEAPLTVGGQGLTLIRTFAVDVAYEESASGNLTTLTFAVADLGETGKKAEALPS